MKYKAVLLDADDTVADFQTAEAKALKRLFQVLKLSMEEAQDDYKRVNRACWEAYEKGEMTQAELRIARFEQFLKLHPAPYTAAEIKTLYEGALSEQSDLLPGALEAVKAIAAKMPVVVVTNGIADIQRPRMEKSALRPYLTHIVISEEVGASKPRPEMIYAALERLGGLSPDEVLMIGDSLTSDMGAAGNAGVDFLWFNPAHKPRPENAHITYETDTVEDFVKYATFEERGGEPMNRWFIRNLPLEISLEEAADILHVSEDDLEDFEEIHADTVKLLSPCLYYGAEKIEANDGKSITLNGIRFESRILSVNTRACSEVYPYVVTSGKAAYDYAQSLTDDLFKFWAHGICEIALKKFLHAAFEKVKAHLQTDALNAMNPGSLADFPISCQQPLFELLGNVEAETGVTLTPTFLMVPVKSGSGVWYRSEKHYQNCMLCPRVDCRNRRAEYDPDKYEAEYAES